MYIKEIFKKVFLLFPVRLTAVMITELTEWEAQSKHTDM